MKQNKLWNRDFTIITLGTVVSLLGSSVSGFIIGIMVLDYTDSTFLFALFMVAYHAPTVIMPLLAGPYLDRFQRKKVIYTLDFISSGIYVCLFLFIRGGLFNYWVLLPIAMLIGAIDGVYRVAYDSLYPNLISEGNYTKAYSVSSMLYPLAACMVPVASFIYNTLGTAAPLFLFNAATFFIAAAFETQIKHKETHFDKTARFNARQYRDDFKEGLQFLKNEKGLLVITAYFVLTFFASDAVMTLQLPFFRANAEKFAFIRLDPYTLYTLVLGCSVVGRVVGGMVQYKLKLPKEKKFAIALFVYTAICLLDGTVLYMPLAVMGIMFFINGVLGVNSYNIRISATQAYLPDDRRARFNGIFNMLTALGSMAGQLLAGALAENADERYIVSAFMAINLIGVWLIMFRGREEVKKIYNQEV